MKLECAGHRTPTCVLNENGFLFWRCDPVFILDLLEGANCGEIGLRFFS
jgi:hypothetical protein